MSLVSVFVDAFKKAAGRGKPSVDIEEVRSTGGLGSTHPTDAFDPLRTAPQPGGDSDVGDRDPMVASGDPQASGESIEPEGPQTS